MKISRGSSILSLTAVFLLSACVTQEPAAVAKPTPPPEYSIAVYGGARRVVVNKTDQILRAFDGDRMVFETRVSTGKEGKRTPNGRFRAQYKERMHYSRLYDNAPMPYSVQFHGNYFLHGYSSVPSRPASHGCIRLPLRDGDHRPAKEFYEWIRPGTPIRVTGSWQD